MHNYRVNTVPFGTPAQWRASRMIRLRRDQLHHLTPTSPTTSPRDPTLTSWTLNDHEICILDHPSLITPRQTLSNAPQPPCGGIAPTCTTSPASYQLLALALTSPREDDHADSIALLSSYISYRQSFAHHPSKKPRFGASNGFDLPSQPEESRRLISETGGFEEDGDMVIEMDLLPPRWVDVQEEVSELLADIATKSAELDKLHQKHLLPGFGDEDLRRHDEGIIERLTQDITRAFHNCQNSIKRIDMMVRESKQQGGVTSGEETMAKNIQISLASRVQESSARFRKKQSTYLKSQSAIMVLSFMPDTGYMRSPAGAENLTLEANR